MKTLQKILQGRIIKSALGTSGLSVVSMGLSLVVSVILTRLLGKEGYGAYAYAINWVFVLNLLATLGCQGLIVREVAANQSRQAWGLINGLLRWSNQLVLLASVGIAIIAGGITWGLSLTREINPALLTTFYIALILQPFIALTTLRQSAMQGLHRVVLGQLPERLVQPLVLMALLVITYVLIPQSVNAPSIMLLRLGSDAIAFIVGAILLYSALPDPIKRVEPEYQSKTWFPSALSLLFINGTSIIFNRTDILMLGFMKGVETVGIYDIANKVSGIILFGLMVGSVVLGPHVARLYAENKLEQLQQLTTKSVRAMCLFSLPLTLFFILFGGWVLHIFNPEFTQGWTVLIILSIGKFMNTATGSVGLLLNMTSHERDNAIVTVTGGIMNVILNSLFIPYWGAEGAAAATAITITICNIWLVALVYKRLSIHSTPLGKIPMPW